MKHLISINLEVEGPSAESLNTEPGSDVHMRALSSAIHSGLAALSVSGELMSHAEYVEGEEDSGEEEDGG